MPRIQKRHEDRTWNVGAAIPSVLTAKFGTLRGSLRTNFRVNQGTSNFMILFWFTDLKILSEPTVNNDRNFKSTTLASCVVAKQSRDLALPDFVQHLMDRSSVSTVGRASGDSSRRFNFESLRPAGQTAPDVRADRYRQNRDGRDLRPARHTSASATIVRPSTAFDRQPGPYSKQP